MPGKGPCAAACTCGNFFAAQPMYFIGISNSKWHGCNAGAVRLAVHQLPTCSTACTAPPPPPNPSGLSPPQPAPEQASYLFLVCAHFSLKREDKGQAAARLGPYKQHGTGILLCPLLCHYGRAALFRGHCSSCASVREALPQPRRKGEPARLLRPLVGAVPEPHRRRVLLA